jgi:non-heme chloroperoxidase
MPMAESALLLAKLIKNATIKVYRGVPHGKCITLKHQANAESLAFIKA